MSNDSELVRAKMGERKKIVLIVDEEKSVRRKASQGSTSPQEVEKEIKKGKELLAQSRELVYSWRKREKESWENLVGENCAF